MIKTLAQARAFVKEVKICTIFSSEKVTYPSLWENVDIPEKQPGEKGWGKKMNAVWTWKNQLPAEFPDDIFYGKIKGGFAVLMDMEYMENEHFPIAYKPITDLNLLAQLIHKEIAVEPLYTSELRKLILQESNHTKSQFDTALKSLQITMNVARLNDPDFEQDKWVLFKELYLNIWNRYINDNN